MSPILEKISLKSYNTFGVEAYARWFSDINDKDDLIVLFKNPHNQKKKILVLGGGSNMLFTNDYDGLVLHINIKGISHRIIDNDVFITAGAGENWNLLVKYCVEHEFAGMENLSLIPGSVGASPVQNIGAYGVELMDIFHSCRAVEIKTGEMLQFNNSDCRFSYRDSIFKNELKNKIIITEVTFKLSKNFQPKIQYGAIQVELNKRGILNPSIRDVSEIVSYIRVSKLPDPATIGNAGSFFKNPVIGVEKFRSLKSAFPDIIHYDVDSGNIKLAAGWLIEECGWKGRRVGDTGTWKDQALVLVNHGNASGIEIYSLSADIINSVQERFGLVLEREVNII